MFCGFLRGFVFCIVFCGFLNPFWIVSRIFFWCPSINFCKLWSKICKLKSKILKHVFYTQNLRVSFSTYQNILHIYFLKNIPICCRQCRVAEWGSCLIFLLFEIMELCVDAAECRSNFEHLQGKKLGMSWGWAWAIPMGNVVQIFNRCDWPKLFSILHYVFLNG